MWYTQRKRKKNFLPKHLHANAELILYENVTFLMNFNIAYSFSAIRMHVFLHNRIFWFGPKMIWANSRQNKRILRHHRARLENLCKAKTKIRNEIKINITQSYFAYASMLSAVSVLVAFFCCIFFFFIFFLKCLSWCLCVLKINS